MGPLAEPLWPRQAQQSSLNVKRMLWAVMGSVLTALACFIGAYHLFPDQGPRFIVSASIPMGLYWAEPVQISTLKPGDAVCFEYAAPAWASPRKYFANGSLLCKFVQGLPGDRIVRITDDVYAQDMTSGLRLLGRMSATDSKGRALLAVLDDRGSLTLRADEFWLGSTAARGFDSRYLGRISAGDIRLKLNPLLLLNDLPF